MIKWLAWQYQKPLEKPHTGIYLYGPQGTGKGTIANVLEAVFGSTAVMRIADQSKLGSMSSVDIWSRTLLVVEEVDVSIKDKLANTIKSFMGTAWVDPKDSYRRCQSLQASKPPLHSRHYQAMRKGL